MTTEEERDNTYPQPLGETASQPALYGMWPVATGDGGHSESSQRVSDVGSGRRSEECRTTRGACHKPREKSLHYNSSSPTLKLQTFRQTSQVNHGGSISREKWGGWETGDLGTDVNNGTTLPLQHLGQELVSHLGCGRGQLDHMMSRDSHMTNLPQLQQKCFHPRSGAISATEKGNYFKTL
jgi:hypothetical protein